MGSGMWRWLFPGLLCAVAMRRWLLQLLRGRERGLRLWRCVVIWALINRMCVWLLAWREVWCCWKAIWASDWTACCVFMKTGAIRFARCVQMCNLIVMARACRWWCRPALWCMSMRCALRAIKRREKMFCCDIYRLLRGKFMTSVAWMLL